MKKNDVGRIFGIVGIIFVVGIIVVAAIVASLNYKVPNSDKVWDPETTVGDMNADNYFIIYSDIVCPYCVAFENAIIEHEEEFQKYIKENDILIEVRLSDFLYEYGQTNPISSRYSAEAVYCAKKEGKFWDYYNYVIPYVWNNYFAVSGKNAFVELNSKNKDFWINIGKEAGFGDDFEKCVKNSETLDEVIAVAAKTVKNIDGMPYFKFNKYIFSGFSLDQGWEHVKIHFAQGLKNK